MNWWTIWLMRLQVAVPAGLLMFILVGLIYGFVMNHIEVRRAAKEIDNGDR